LSSRYTYNPHSHRLLYVDRRVARAQRESVLLGQALLRAAEDEFHNERDQQRAKSILGQFGGFSHTSPIPLVLGAVLEMANNPIELLTAALDLRNRSSARRYRRWLARLAEAVHSGNSTSQAEIEGELSDAREYLFRELRNIVTPDPRWKTTSQAAATVAGVANPNAIAGLVVGDLIGPATETLAKVIGSAPAFANRYHLRQRERKVVLILELAREASQVGDLNECVRHVFGYGLTDLELDRFFKLQVEHGRRAAAISRLMRNIEST
jgi:hypothetical protein